MGNVVYLLTAKLMLQLRMIGQAYCLIMGRLPTEDSDAGLECHAEASRALLRIGNGAPPIMTQLYDFVTHRGEMVKSDLGMSLQRW